MSDHATRGTEATDLLRVRHRDIETMFDDLLEATLVERVEIFECLRASLAVHETAEEIVVHPMARSFGEGARISIEARLAEEQEAKQMLRDLEKLGVEEPDFLQLATVLRHAVLAHAEVEERDEFALLDVRCTPDEQARMAERIRTAERMAPTHPHPHGPQRPLGNLLVGPFVAMADKVRDALAR